MKIVPFIAKNQADEEFNLADLIGKKKIVIYFYPKDNTPGCTVQAESFRDFYADFGALNCEVIGISRDSVKSHSGFCQKYSLPFTLISDPKGDIYGKYGLERERATFAFDENGELIQVWRNVKVNGHIQAVLDEIGSYGK